METKLDILTLRGPAGMDLEFDIYPLDSELQHIACVFIITAFYMDIYGNFGYKVIYVGQTGDIKIQLDANPKWECFNSHHANCLGIDRRN